MLTVKRAGLATSTIVCIVTPLVVTGAVYFRDLNVEGTEHQS
jgi:hypothetical protein